MPALGLLVLRFTLAAILVAHGAHQLFGAFDGPGVGPGGLAHTARYFAALGLTPAVPVAVLSGLVQLLGGALLVVGLWVRTASVLVIAYLGLEIWKDQVQWGFFLNWMSVPARGQGFEYSAVLIGALLCLVLGGGGDWSLDGRRTSHAASRAAARARL